MSTDQEWAQALFERSRQGEEPVWVADHAAMMRAGRRRTRIRTLTVAGSVVTTAAVVAAVGIGVGGAVDRKTPAPAPGNSAAPPTPAKTPAKGQSPVAADPSKVLDYVVFGGFSPKQNGNSTVVPSGHHLAVPQSTARDSMRLLTSLDPTLADIAKATGQSGDFARLVPDNDPEAQDEAKVMATVLWTKNGMSAQELRAADATAPTGTMNLSFDDAAGTGPQGQTICSFDAEASFTMLHPVQITGGWRDAAQWSPCAKTTLPDGSLLLSSTKTDGPFSMISVTRQFPGNKGEVALTWQNFATPVPTAGQAGERAPDPKRVLSPDPLTLAKLQAALSDNSLVPPLTPLPPVSIPPTMLQASDFGAGWTADTAGSTAETGTLVVDNGCVNEQNPVASPQPIYTFSGPTPSGLKVTATAQVDVMKPGSGPGWMSDLRQHGTGGCDSSGLPYSHDTMTALASGIGDDAFIENWYGQGSETFFIRFGDAVMRVDVTTEDGSMPAFTQADKDWFSGLATKAAARHSGKS